MSRLRVVSWITSAVVHTSVFALLGSLLLRIPVQQAEIAGQRVVVSSQMSISIVEPLSRADPFRVEPVEDVPLPDPTLADLPARSGLPMEDIPPTPTMPEKSLDVDELQKLDQSQSPRIKPKLFAQAREAFVPPARPLKSLQPQSTNSVQAHARPIKNANDDPKPELTRRRDRLVVDRKSAELKPVVKPVELPSQQTKAQVAGTTKTTPAKPIDNPRPVYPPLAIRQRHEGLVVLRVTIADDGHVAKVSVANSSGHRHLDEAALDAVQQWQFSPASRDGRPVQWTARLPVRFRLEL